MLAFSSFHVEFTRNEIHRFQVQYVMNQDIPPCSLSPHRDLEHQHQPGRVPWPFPGRPGRRPTFWFFLSLPVLEPQFPFACHDPSDAVSVPPSGCCAGSLYGPTAPAVHSPVGGHGVGLVVGHRGRSWAGFCGLSRWLLFELGALQRPQVTAGCCASCISFTVVEGSGHMLCPQLLSPGVAAGVD